MSFPPRSRQTTAVYYPAAIWTDGDWLKSALLFFDHVTLLRRDAEHAATTVLDQELLDLLGEKRLITVADPADLMDQQASARLRAALTDPGVAESLDKIGADRRFYYGARVFSTLNGPEPSLEMMEMRNVLMRRLGAGDFVDQEVGGHAYPTYRVSGQQPDVPVHIRLWAPLMSALPHYLRAADGSDGLQVPLSDHHSGGSALARLLRLEEMPTADWVSVIEPVAVAPNLADVPWRDVLHLREDVRGEAADLINLLYGASRSGPASSGGESEAFEDAAEALRRRITGLVGRRPYFQLGAVGAKWDAAAAEASGLAALAQLLGTGTRDNHAWTAVFRGGDSIVA